MYNHLGAFASLGSEQAAMELPGDVVSSGFGSMMLWYGVYFSNCVSWQGRSVHHGQSRTVKVAVINSTPVSKALLSPPINI